MKERWNHDTLTLALCIAVFPPIWAVLAPYMGVQTGAVALICAGVYVANGNCVKDSLRMSLGFLAGDVWAVLAIFLMDCLHWNADLELFAILFVLGSLAVLCSSLFPQLFYCAAWLCGWAIGLTVLSPMGLAGIGTYPIQIAVSMLIGIWYVGVFLEIIHQKLLIFIKNRNGGRMERT